MKCLNSLIKCRIKHFIYITNKERGILNDKVDDVYRRETDRVIERLEEEYKQYVKKYF